MADQHNDDLVIHILLHGRAYCGIEGVPRVWPAKHKWVPVVDRKDANCPGCLAFACETCGNPLEDTPGGSPRDRLCPRCSRANGAT